MTKDQVQDLLFQTVFEQMTVLADAAGNEWWRKQFKLGPSVEIVDHGRVVDAIYDCCGFVWIQPTDKRSAFWKWGVKKHDWSIEVGFPYRYASRQEMGLKEMCCGAALEYLRKVGIRDVRLYSQID